MSTVVDEDTRRISRTPAARLRATMAAMRLSFTWFGTRKSLSTEQKARAADAFDAAGEFLSAGKKLIDTSHPKFKAVTTVRNRAVSLFKGHSLPYPEPGLRLVRQDEIEMLSEHLTQLQEELNATVDELDQHFSELKSAARGRLGRLYAESDYPASLAGLFAMTWDFPSVEPPEYLRRLSPELYQQEAQRVAARFDEAVALAEAAFSEELAKLVEHLSERLSGGVDGKPKVFRDSAITNLTEFFERFSQLNVRSSEELDQLVERAQQVVRGVQPQQLRDDAPLRKQITNQLASVQSALDGLLVDRPRRAILRRPR